MTYSEFRNQQKSFATSEGSLKYIDTGQGEVLLLLHGVPTSGWLYRHMIPLLSQHYRLIVPDMLGFGSSDSPSGYDIYAEVRHAQRLLELMDYLEIEHWNHVMHDAGGLWTWELVRLQPHRISKLTILNTIIYEAGFKPPIRFKPGILARTAMWGYRNGITTNLMLKGLFNSGLIKNTLTKSDLEGYKIPLRKGKTRAMYYFFTQTCNKLTDYTQILKEFKNPVQIIWGTEDDFLLWKPQQDAVVNDLKLGEENLHLINAKHFIQEEKPEEISDYILKFVG